MCAHMCVFFLQMPVNNVRARACVCVVRHVARDTHCLRSQKYYLNRAALDSARTSQLGAEKPRHRWNGMHRDALFKAAALMGVLRS